MVVYTDRPSEFETLAEEIATDRGEDLVTDIDDIPPEELVLYVGSPSTLDDSVLLALQQRLLKHGPKTAPFSVVTGLDIERARRLYRQKNDAEGEHVMFLQDNSEKSIAADDDAAVYVDEEVSTETARRLCEEKPVSLNFNASAWPIHVNLSDGFICGFPESADFSKYDDTQPFCVDDGERNCPLTSSENLVPAEELSASHLFFASCGSMIDNVTTGIPVHVGLGLIDGAESLIGSYRPGPSLPYEAILHYSLLRAGYDLNERCYVLNKNANTQGIMGYPYVPFGRPRAGVAPSPEPDHTLATVDGNTVRIENVDGHVVDVSVPAEHVPGDGDRVYVRNAGERVTETPLYYLAFEERDDVRIFLYTGSRMNIDALDLELDTYPADRQRREIANAALENGELYRRMEMLDRTGERQLTNLRKQLHNLQEPTSEEGHQVDAHRTSSDHLDEIFGNVNALEEGLVEDLSDGYPERYQYGPRAVDDNVLIADFDCHGCGRNVFIKQVSLGTAKDTRALGTCANCGYIFDVPTHPGDASPTYPVPTGELWDSDDRYRDLEVQFENPTDDHMQATFLPTLLRVGTETRLDDDIFEPGTVQVELEPGEETVVEFTIDTKTVKRMQHYLRVTVFGNLMMYTGENVMLVGDKTGYLHPKDW